jgi:hypothetical protein
MMAKRRDIDNYGDVYRIEIRHDAEPTANSESPCTPSKAVYKIYSVKIISYG